MSINELNTEPGDTLIITVDAKTPSSKIRHLQEDFHNIFRGQNMKVLILYSDTDITLIKSSNLEDNTDIDLRENNPALQDAWEQYQVVKNLTVNDNES